MKLSEMNTRELKTALCALAAPAASIANSEDFVAVLKKMADVKKANGTVVQLASVFLGDGVPVLLETHEKEIFAILSALTGKSYDEIMEQNGMQTIKDIRESVDSTLLGFFN